MKKALSLILVLAFAISAMLGIASSAAETEESEKLVISQANLQFGSTVYLLIAIDYSAVYSDVETAMEKVSITVDGEELTADAEVMAIDNFPANCVGFKYTKLSAKNMGDELAIKAYADGEEHSSTTYSVLEYTIQAKNLHSDDAYLMDVVDKLLVFGATAQTAFLPEGETVATAYDYDLTKAHSLAKLVDSINPKNGTSKVILEEGRTMPIQATDAVTNAGGLFWYDGTVALRAQSEAGSSIGELAYTTDKTQNIFVVPKTQSLFMDSYIGDTVYYYADTSTGKNVTHFIDRNLNSVTNPISVFSPANISGSLTAAPETLTDVTDLKGSGTINPGYIMIRGTANTNLTKAVAADRIIPMVDEGYTQFTFSVTMATTDANSPAIPLGYITLRAKGNGTLLSTTEESLRGVDGSMLSLIRATSGGIIQAGTNADATVAKAGAESIPTLLTPSEAGILNGTNKASNPSDFFTVHAVVTLAGHSDASDARTGTIAYYVSIGDEFLTNEEGDICLATINHYAFDSYFTDPSTYPCFYLGGTNSAYRGYLKNVVVTAGDIVNDYK